MHKHYTDLEIDGSNISIVVCTITYTLGKHLKKVLTKKLDGTKITKCAKVLWGKKNALQNKPTYSLMYMSTFKGIMYCALLYRHRCIIT